jgi:tetratricopeptide (TPR) repeat protein
MRFIVAVAAVAACQASADAQVVVAGGFGPKGGVAFSVGGPRFHGTGFCTNPFAGCGPYAFSPWGFYAPSPLVVVVPQPVIVLPRGYDLHGFDDGPPRPVEPRPPVNLKNWHVIQPKKPPEFPVVARPPVPNLPPDEREADPRREAARQVRVAQAAFAADEYGRAVERLDAAIRLTPNEPLPHFLLAQVRFARGEYAEAAAAIRDGLKLAPDWPASAFSPKPLYAANPARFDEQLAELRAAAAVQPGDVTVQFVLAYQLWFKGDRDEAAKLFRTLAPKVKEKAMVEAFLNVADVRLVKK